MAWLEGKRVAQLAALSALLMVGVGCSSDDSSSSDSTDNSDDESSDETGATDDESSDDDEADAGKPMDASKPPMDAAPPKATSDAGDSGSIKLPPTTLPDGGPIVVNPPTSGTATELTPLPADGEKTSTCYSKLDCMGDDLVCFMPPGQYPGTCVDDCQTDADCPAVDGVKSSCDLLSGECTFPCGGTKNDGKGKCPDDMVCRNINTTPVSSTILPDYKCTYPVNGGKRNVQQWGQCNLTHFDGDCEGGAQYCYGPHLGLATNTLVNGYCTPKCSKDSDCKGGEGVSAIGLCNVAVGRCEFSCSNKGAVCPRGMNCFDIDDSRVSATMRCIYLNDI